MAQLLARALDPPAAAPLAPPPPFPLAAPPASACLETSVSSAASATLAAADGAGAKLSALELLALHDTSDEHEDHRVPLALRILDDSDDEASHCNSVRSPSPQPAPPAPPAPRFPLPLPSPPQTAHNAIQTLFSDSTRAASSHDSRADAMDPVPSAGRAASLVRSNADRKSTEDILGSQYAAGSNLLEFWGAFLSSFAIVELDSIARRVEKVFGDANAGDSSWPLPLGTPIAVLSSLERLHDNVRAARADSKQPAAVTDSKQPAAVNSADNADDCVTELEDGSLVVRSRFSIVELANMMDASAAPPPAPPAPRVELPPPQQPPAAPTARCSTAPSRPTCCAA